MKCSKCQSENVNVQAVTEIVKRGKGCLYWLLIGWWLELLLWIFLTLPMLLIKLFIPSSIKSKTITYAVCQNCGHKWKV